MGDGSLCPQNREAGRGSGTVTMEVVHAYNLLCSVIALYPCNHVA